MAPVSRIISLMKLWPQRLDGLTAQFGDDLLRGPDDAGVMDDLLARFLGEEGLRQQAHHVFARDEAALVVEEEAAVEIAVPGDADIRAVLNDGAGGLGLVVVQQRVRDAVGEAAVGLMIDADELQRRAGGLQRFGDGVEGGPAAPFPALTSTFMGVSAETSTNSISFAT
jgi:hypothetical protein